MTFGFLNVPRGGGGPTGLGNIPKKYQFSFIRLPLIALKALIANHLIVCPTQLKVIQVFKSAFPSLPSVRRAPSQSLSTQNCASSGDCGPGRKYFSSWHIGNVSLWYVDETFLDRLQMFFCQSEEVSVIDDRSIFSLLDEIFHKLLLLFREQHLAGNESICQHRES